ncbi:unnamed protein product, partial [Ilex paraguariensis]
MGGGRGRSRTQRKHFRQGRENVWKRSKVDSQQEQEGDAGTATLLGNLSPPKTPLSMNTT